MFKQPAKQARLFNSSVSPEALTTNIEPVNSSESPVIAEVNLTHREIPSTQQLDNLVPEQKERRIRNRKGLQDCEQQIKLARPELEFGQALADGGCFFDALAQALNQAQDANQYDEKLLRQACHRFYINNKALVDKWNAEDSSTFLEKDEYNLVQYSSAELSQHFNHRSPIWGRPAIEGVMLCRELELHGILTLEILLDVDTQQLVAGYFLANKENYKQLTDEQVIQQLLADKSIPKLAVGQKSLHFVPILHKATSTQKENTARQTPAIPIKYTSPSFYRPSKHQKSLANRPREVYKGFLPANGPVEHLDGVFENLVDIANKLPELLKNNMVKTILELIPYFPSIACLTSYEAKRRAYAVIVALCHAYIYEAGKTLTSEGAVRLPEKLAKLLYDSAKALHRTPTQTYETYILENWRVVNRDKPMDYDNLEPLITYTGMDDEKWFIKVHVMCEFIAADAIKAARNIKHLFASTERRDEYFTKELIEHLQTIQQCLKKLMDNFDQIRRGCSPDNFFKHLRPYLKNWAGGVIFSGVNEKEYGDKVKKFRGASGAQSSIIPAMDSILNLRVEQHETMQDILHNYMPPEHIEFIKHLRCNLRDEIIRIASSDLIEEYNKTVDIVKRVREKHYAIFIHDYILNFIPKEVLQKDGALGTGGTDFRVFLQENIAAAEASKIDASKLELPVNNPSNYQPD